MFIQIIQGKTADKEALHRQLDRWESELRPSAKGYLGETSGVTDDGQVFIAARFESEALAMANSDRPEQGAWWAEMEKCFSGTPTFMNSSDIDIQMEPSNDAGFVQVIQSRAVDRERIREMNAEFASLMSESRPDITGAITVWSGDECCEIAYFTNEAAAREGERKQLPEASRRMFEEWQSLIKDPTYLDIRDPWLY